MRVNRYKWTPTGMIYDNTFGAWIGQTEHEAIVAFYEAQLDQLDSSKEVQIASLNTAVSSTTDELDAANATIAELQKQVNVIPIDPLISVTPVETKS